MFLGRDQLQRLIRRAADLTDDEVRRELQDVPLALLDHQMAADEFNDIGGGLFGGAAFLAPTAAQFTCIGIRNPVGSGVIVTVKGWTTRNEAGTQTEYRIVRPPAAATAVTGSTTQCINLDSRKPGLAAPILLLSTSLVGPPGNTFHLRPLGDLSLRYIDVVLDEGSELWAAHDTVNIANNSGFWGYYRPRGAAQIAQV